MIAVLLWMQWLNMLGLHSCAPSSVLTLIHSPALSHAIELRPVTFVCLQVTDYGEQTQALNVLLEHLKKGGD